MARKVKIFVLEDGGVFKARPPQADAAPGDTVRFVNLTGSQVDLSFAQTPFKTNRIRLGALGSGEHKVEEPVLNVPDGRYPYQGVVTVGSARLVGESDPEIIIDR